MIIKTRKTMIKTKRLIKNGAIIAGDGERLKERLKNGA